MKNQIILMPRAGLGNRMRAISSFIHLKEKINANLYILWFPDSGLNAEYHDLFESNPHFKVIEDRNKFKILFTKRGGLNHANAPIRKIFRAYNDLVKKIVNVDAIINEDDVQKGYLHVENIIKNHETVFVNTSNEIIDNIEGLRTFQPTPDVMTKVNTTLEKFPETTIGIHIRRTDHNIAIKNSPLHLFENKISWYCRQSKNLKFFIATDDQSVEKKLNQKFKGRCIFYNKTFGRNSKEGIIDAVVEMYLLSKTQKLYGSFWSSFSIISAKISGIEYELLNTA